VGKVALVGQPLGDAGQLRVPLELAHVCRWWKPRQPTCNAAAEAVVMVDNLFLFPFSQSTITNSAALGSHSLVPAKCVLL